MKAFDNQKYKLLQKAELERRTQKFGRIYLEVGGKLFDDNHAARVLPGFEPDVKMQIFAELSSELEAILCINANDIIAQKVRGDNHLTYGDELLRMATLFSDRGINVCAVVITFYSSHPLVSAFEEKCKAAGLTVRHSHYIENYPEDIKTILSDNGFGKNDYVNVTKNLVLVSAPGANSGKMQTCLNQIYHDKLSGKNSYYAKYETFPVYNLPLSHLVNVAYEMATADIGDQNMIDPFHKAEYDEDAVNYNRDIAAFPILSKMLNNISGEKIYKSPTEMGINNVGNAIVDDNAVQVAAYQEIERRYLKDKTKYAEGKIDLEAFERSGKIMNHATELLKKLNTKN